MHSLLDTAGRQAKKSLSEEEQIYPKLVQRGSLISTCGLCNGSDISVRLQLATCSHSELHCTYTLKFHILESFTRAFAVIICTGAGAIRCKTTFPVLD